MSVPNLKWIALFFQKLLGGSQNFEFGSSDPKPRPLWGHFMIQGCVLYVCASASEAAALWRYRSFFIIIIITGPSSISVPNLKQISPFVQKL